MICKYCGKEFEHDLSVPSKGHHREYCERAECKKARRAKYMRTYRANIKGKSSSVETKILRKLYHNLDKSDMTTLNEVLEYIGKLIEEEENEG